MRPWNGKPRLTPRELEVLHHLSHGATTKQVARDLGISRHTVNTLLERVFDKLEVNDRAQAVAIALRRGLVR